MNITACRTFLTGKFTIAAYFGVHLNGKVEYYLEALVEGVFLMNLPDALCVCVSVCMLVCV